jgi:hypothetical protein
LIPAIALVHDPAEACDRCRDHQICIKAAERQRLPADQRTERNPQKEGAVVPCEDGGAAGGKIVCKPDLLSREEQLRSERAHCEGEVDEYCVVERQPQQQNAETEASERDGAGQPCSEPISQASADQGATDRPAAIKQDHLDDFLGRIAE